MTAVCDVLMWRRPLTAILILGFGTLAYYHCTTCNRNIVSLLADFFLVLAIIGGIVGIISRSFNLPVPLDPTKFEVSQEAAESVVASLVNVLGAAEGVLRVAASGSDPRLFLKVVFVLYTFSTFGRIFSGTTTAYLVLLFLFIVPVLSSKLLPGKETGNCRFLKRPLSIAIPTGNMSSVPSEDSDSE